jgi:hypothetical protein
MDSHREMFETLEILRLCSQYMFSLSLCVVDEQTYIYKELTNP